MTEPSSAQRRSAIHDRPAEFDTGTLPTTDEIRQLLRAAIEELYREERELLASQTHEQALVFRIGQRLINWVERADSTVRVDVEYNRHGDKRKTLGIDGAERDRRPDLIVHIRGRNGANLLVVEAKRGRTNIENDREKLRKFQKEPYMYTNAVLLLLGDRPQWQWMGEDPGLTNVLDPL